MTAQEIKQLVSDIKTLYGFLEVKEIYQSSAAIEAFERISKLIGVKL